MNPLAVSNDVQLLQGSGEEILTDSEGNPIAKFYDGNLVCNISVASEEITLPMFDASGMLIDKVMLRGTGLIVQNPAES